MKHFRDNFSTQADLYARFRPLYPEALYEFIASLCPGRQLAWDAGTGNGQAAVALSRHFKKVIATDPSASQIKNAIPAGNITYLVQTAEAFECEEKVDLITAANALHWFANDGFYDSVKAVAGKQAILAAWCYAVPKSDTGTDCIVDKLHNEILEEFWEEPNHIVANEYRDLYFPFPEETTPQFHTEKQFNLSELLQYLMTWSAAVKFENKYGKAPVTLIENELKSAWGNPDQRHTFRWKLTLKIAKIHEPLP